MSQLRKMKMLGRYERGALMVVVLLVLMIVSMLGLSSMDTTGIQMQMSSNSREQQLAFEAAEYTLSWVENSIQTTGGFSEDSLDNAGSCGSVCFDDMCTNGYCFAGTDPTPAPTSLSDCTLDVPAEEFYESEALWEDDSGFHQTLVVGDITTKYIIEFRCYTALDASTVMDALNYTPLFRITAFATAEGGKARAMVRSTVKLIP